MDFKKLNKEQLLNLYDKAKEAYYNGEEIMSDAEFDKLEAYLGLENKGYVGTRKNSSFTCKHSFGMGSLSKVQIKEDRKTHEINWDEAAAKISRFLNKSQGTSVYETTPKLDGCSFSAEFININDKAVLKQVATRGDHEYGKDLRKLFEIHVKKYPQYWSKIDDAVAALCEVDSDEIFCIRGEILIDANVFKEQHSNTFTNPRSFVSGVTNTKWNDNDKVLAANAESLHWVCYDYRTVDETGVFTELSWMNPSDSTYSMLSPYLNHIGQLPDKEYCQIHEFNGAITAEDIQEIYYDYEEYRNNKCPYALDGVVFKPAASNRVYNEKDRPEDCVAMKFIPIDEATEITNIIWKVGKTGEYAPIAIFNPVILDGKKVTKASLHNYGYIMSEKVGIGSKVRIGLAGDIIPRIEEVVEHVDPTDNINQPEDAYVVADKKSGALHLMKNFEDNDRIKNQFMSSANVLNIPFVGPAAAESLWNSLHDQFASGLTNLLQLLRDDFDMDIIFDIFGNGKSVQNIVKSLQTFKQQITPEDVIESFCFKSCGRRASVLCAKILSGSQNYSTVSMPAVAYQWALNPDSVQYKEVMDMFNALNINITDGTDSDTEQTGERIPIIMTGDPSKCTEYATKKQWLDAHPEYVETSSWKSCKILFTNDLQSTTGKMAKAAKAGIPVKLYENKRPQNKIKSAAKIVYNVVNEAFSNKF